MSVTYMIGSLIVVVLITRICAQVDVYYVDVIDIPDITSQRQVPQQQAHQQSTQTQQTVRARSVNPVQPQFQPTTTLQEVVVQQLQPAPQRQQRLSSASQAQVQQQSQRKQETQKQQLSQRQQQTLQPQRQQQQAQNQQQTQQPQRQQRQAQHQQQTRQPQRQQQQAQRQQQSQQQQPAQKQQKQQQQSQSQQKPQQPQRQQTQPQRQQQTQQSQRQQQQAQNQQQTHQPQRQQQQTQNQQQTQQPQRQQQQIQNQQQTQKPQRQKQQAQKQQQTQKQQQQQQKPQQPQRQQQQTQSQQKPQQPQRQQQQAQSQQQTHQPQRQQQQTQNQQQTKQSQRQQQHSQQPQWQQQPQSQQQPQQPTRHHTQQPQKDVIITFPGNTNIASPVITQNAELSRPTNPFLTAASSRVPQVEPSVYTENTIVDAGGGGQGASFASATRVPQAKPLLFNENTIISADRGDQVTAFTSATRVPQIKPSVYTTNSVVGVDGGGQVTAFGSATNDGFDSASSSSINNFSGFGEQTNSFASGTSTSYINNANSDGNRLNGLNNFGQFTGGSNGVNNNPYGGVNGANNEDVNNYRRFNPRRPNANHYRDFAGIFNAIDQKAETDYNTSAENDEMNDDFNGRSVVAPGQYPHMSALGYRTSSGDTEFKCGGSLISEMFVLTAAHCCFLNGQAPHLVKIGDIRLKESEDYVEPQQRGISRVLKHPYYNESMHYHDIGLLELTNPIDYTYFVRPIRLWARDEIPYNMAFTMGYGSTSFAKAPTNVLTELDLSIVPLETCNRTIPPDQNTPYGVIESQICAKDFEKNRDTCQGDSGGPLQLNLERPLRRRLRYYLVGVISYGTFCRSQQPGVYTRVSSYIDWIASEVWPDYFNNF